MNDKTLEELRYYFNGYGSRHDETILKLIDRNKRYREALDKIEALWKNATESTDDRQLTWLMYSEARKALEELE